MKSALETQEHMKNIREMKEEEKDLEMLKETHCPLP